MKLWLSLCVALAAASPAAAQGPPPLAVDPPELIVAPGQASATGQLVFPAALTAAGPRRIRVLAIPALQDELVSPLGFPDNRGQGWIELELRPGGNPPLKFDASPPADPGLYRGRLELSDTTDGAALGTAPVVVRRADTHLVATIGGPAAQDGALGLTTGDTRSSVTFSVRNADDKVTRSFALQVPPVAGSRDQTQPHVTFVPSLFRLAPGEQEQVVAEIDDAGDTAGEAVRHILIRLEDRSDPALYRNVLLTYQHVGWAGSPRWAVLGTFLLVFAGAALSVIVRMVFPTGLTQRRNRAALTATELIIRRCTSASTLLKSSLLAESGGIRLANAAIHWYSADRVTQTEAVARMIESLAAKRDVAVRISSARDNIRNQAELPFRTLIGMEQSLNEAESLLILNRTDAASGKIDEAETRRQASLVDANLTRLRSDLQANAESFARLLEAKPHLPMSIRVRAQGVIDDAKAIATLSIPEVVAAEHASATVSCFADEFLPSLERYKYPADIQDLVVRMLETDRGPLNVAGLVAILRVGITPAMLHEALVAGTVRIMTEPDRPFYSSLMQYWLHFDDIKLNGLSAVRQLMTYEWEFDDNTQSVRAERGQHFYVRAWQPRHLFCRKSNFALSCNVTLPSVAGAQPVRIGPINIKPRPPTGTMGLSAIELANFLVTALLAVLAAYAAQYTSVVSLNSLSAWLTPFLFGFGLDQLRSPTTR